MLSMTIIDMLSALFFSLMDFLPRLDVLQIPQKLFEGLEFLLNCAAYFLPITDIMAILTSFLVITNFRFFYNIFNRIWDMLPFT